MNINLTKLKKVTSLYFPQIIIFFSFILIYLITRYPGVGGRLNFGDSAKWQYIHLANGLPHGTGYPQFLFLSEVFSRLVFFLDLSERITFISIVFGTLSLVVFYSLLNVLTKNKIGSFISTLLVGFSYVFWIQATEAEVYTLNIFYLLTVFYLFIQFYLTKNSNYYLVGCAVYALSFGNHLSMITILPAVAFISFITDYRVVIKPKNIALVALFVFLGALQYAFIYYRAYHSDPGYIEIVPDPTLAQFMTYLTGSDKPTMLAFTFNQIIDARIPVLLNFVRINFTYLGILFAFAGFFYYLYVKKAHIVLGFLTLAMLGQVAFNISYNINDLIVFFTPVYVIVGLFIGLVFSANQDLIPKITLSLLILYLFSSNIYSKNIVVKNTYWLNHFKPVVSLYQQQKDNIPFYMPIPEGDYVNRTYLRYINLSGDIAPKSIIPDLKVKNLDSFYVFAPYADLIADYYAKPVVVESLYDYIKNINKPNNAVFFSIKEVGSQNIPLDFVNFLKSYGSKIESLPVAGKYAAVLYEGKLVEAISEAGPAIIDSDSLDNNYYGTENDPLNGALSYALVSGHHVNPDSSAIIIEGHNYSVNRKGINIVAFDLDAGEVRDMASFDTALREEKRLFKAVKKEHALKSSGAPVGQTVWLQSKNNLYLSSENGISPMASKKSAGAWEKFLVVDAGEGKIALKNGDKYVSSENGNGPMSCNRTSIGEWEKFDWVKNSDGTISLWGSGWRLVSLENGIGPVVCNRTKVGDWERFSAKVAQ